jgi:uncharacterized protein
VNVDYEREVTITKVDHQGRPLISYPGAIVYADPSCIVARCTWTLRVMEMGPFLLEPGDIWIEFYYCHEPFNIMVIYDRQGRIKGWYCNVTEQVEIAPDEIRWRDLALDLLILPDGRQTVLDEDEFEALDPSSEARARAASALATLNAWIIARRCPFIAGMFDAQAGDVPRTVDNYPLAD